MTGRAKVKTGIVALERTQGACPVVTFQFPSQSASVAASASLVVTLTLCEWQRVAQQIAEAGAVIGN